MKILIFGDIHGRDFWIDPSKEIDKFDKVIFLGDYHDPYKFQVSEHTSRKRLRECLIPFVEENKDKVICLLGNHDCSYLNVPIADRFDYYNQEEIRDLLNKLDLKLAYKIDNYLFSHSGILNNWLIYNQITLEDVLNNNVSYPKLDQISRFRGGLHNSGSCVWGDVHEFIYDFDKPKDLYQIFGHTQLDNEIITETWACLDCRKAFILDTELKTLKPF